MARRTLTCWPEHIRCGGHQVMQWQVNVTVCMRLTEVSPGKAAGGCRALEHPSSFIAEAPPAAAGRVLFVAPTETDAVEISPLPEPIRPI